MRDGNLLTALTRTCLSTYILLSIGIGPTALLPTALAKVACNDTSTCETAYRPGSTCKEGHCTNPFAQGCLRRLRGADLHPRLRTCNSDDTGPGVTSCVASPLDYEEVRIGPNNWESAMFYAWILQILLSEVLDVPATLDTGPGGGALNFYDEQNGFAYPTKANDIAPLYKANEVGDCRDTDEPCAHVITEMWQLVEYDVNDTAVEREGNGMVGHLGWLIPRAAAIEDPSLTHYLGLAGPKNRQKLADTFKRPQTWQAYCRDTSPNNCTTPNNVTTRAPADEAEGSTYFVEGGYTGHFVATGENDCAATPNCTGHIIDYPCTWSAHTASQLYWNDISLDTNALDGTNTYSYGSIVQIIQASVATKNHIMIVWWYPDPTMDLFDFVWVSLPEASRECLSHRPLPASNRCNATREELIGEKVGSCGYITHTLQKYFAVSSRRRSARAPVAVRSPGHQLLRNAHFSDVDLQEMMLAWRSRGVDTYNYDPREAVCSWVANNFDQGLNLQKFIPRGYPREIEDEVGYDMTLMRVATAYGVVGAIAAVSVCFATHKYRAQNQIKCAQEFFLYLFALGLFFVSLGGIMYSLVPSAGSCAARWWFVMIGFTLSLVPLFIKIAAINKCMNDAKKLRRTNVSKEKVYKTVAGFVSLVVVYLAVWTGIDAPASESSLVLVSEFGNVVEVHIQCASKSILWELIAFSWEGALICSAATVAFLSRKIQQAFNESRAVGNAAYAIFFFLVFRLLVFFLPIAVLQPSYKNVITSLLLTSESLITIGIYFGPKFRSIYKRESEAIGQSSFMDSAAFASTANGDMCPLCERKLPAYPQMPARSTVVNERSSTLAETPITVKKLSDHDITSASDRVETPRAGLHDTASAGVNSKDDSM